MNNGPIHLVKVGASSGNGSDALPVRKEIPEAQLATQNGEIAPTDLCYRNGETPGSVANDPQLCRFVPPESPPKRPAVNAEMSTTTMADLGFLVLIFFIVNFAAVVLKSIEVSSQEQDKKADKSPVSEFGGAAKPKPFQLVLRVHPKGNYSVDGVTTKPLPSNRSELQQLVKTAVEKTRTETLTVVHSAGTDFEHVVMAFDVAKSLRLTTSWGKHKSLNK